MRYFGSLIAVCYFLLAANAAQDDLAKKDLDSLQGVWRFISFVSDGRPRPEEELKGLKLTIKGNKWIEVEGDNKGLESTIKLDPSKKPKAIDITALAGPAKGKPSLGIYSIEGDTLKTCAYNTGGSERPTEFKAIDGVNLFVLKREKR
jgi:uncharacterized protein (TIGR03067 family)